MDALQQLFRDHGADYLERFADIPANHKKVIGAIQRCRSDQAGHTLYHCQGCGKAHVIARSCGNRHCPGCQQQKTQAWLQCQLQRQLPGHHFMLTFTVPESLRGLLRSHQRIGYDALFQASAGAISQHDRQWHASSAGFYLPVRALSVIYRAKFRDAMAAHGLLADIPAELWGIDWNVHCQAVGDGQATLAYLARYLFKVAICDRRIAAIDDQAVRFRYRKAHSNRPRTMSLPIAEFMRRFLQHVLPSGFQKVRRFGFLSPGCAVPLQEVRARIEMAHGFAEQATLAPISVRPPEPMRCPHCGGSLRFVRAIAPPRLQGLIGAPISALSHSGP